MQDGLRRSLLPGVLLPGFHILAHEALDRGAGVEPVVSCSCGEVAFQFCAYPEMNLFSFRRDQRYFGTLNLVSLGHCDPSFPFVLVLSLKIVSMTISSLLFSSRSFSW